MYKPVDPKVSFPKMEEGIVRFWEAGRIFEKSISQREGKDEFVFYDGPPFATGLPHFGHFVPGTIKDIIPRYKTMRGFKVERRFGWDCHGLPVENLIEKELGLDSKTDIERYGIANFNEACRASVLRYVKEWRDHHDPRRALGRLRPRLQDHGPGLHGVHLVGHEEPLGQGPRLRGPLYPPLLPALRRQSSRTTSSPWAATRTCTTRRSRSSSRSAVPAPRPRCLASPTGTTLPPRLDDDALDPALQPRPLPRPGHRLRPREDAEPTARRRALRPRRVAARRLLQGRGDPRDPLAQEGRRARGHRVRAPLPLLRRRCATQSAFRTYTGSHVTTEDGTGIVHTAPGFGEEDHEVMKGTGVPTICPIDAECKFTDEVSDYAGRFVKDATRRSWTGSRPRASSSRREQILHAYPALLALRASPHLPRRSAAGSSRSTRSSRRCSRPTRRSTGCRSTSRTAASASGSRAPATGPSLAAATGAIPCPSGSAPTATRRSASARRAELEKLSGVKLTDLHKHFVDEVTLPLRRAAATMRRIPEVLDCWFESGSMPYAQVHYPFENKERFEEHFPADFICEGLDQTRGWFYTLTVLAAGALRRPRLQGLRRQRPRPRRGRQEDVQVASATSPTPRR